VINISKLPLILVILVTVTTLTVYAAQTVTDRTVIDDDDPAVTLAAGDLFGYQIEAITDIDSNGTIDLAVINFSDDSSEANVGSILILFMNADGSVASTNEIIMDDSVGNLAGCLGAASLNRDTGSLEQLAFVGDLDGDGEVTIALGANSNDHDTGGGVIVDTGAVYMLELNSDGTVDNCVLITEDSGGFAPADGVYQQDAAANFGWPILATDLNGDGQNELLVGANSESNLQTDLWPLFLTTTGSVSSHPAIPVSGLTIGIDSNEFIADGASISGTKIVVSNENDGDGGGSVFIVNLSSAGAFVSSTEIEGSTIPGVANDERFGSGVAPLGDMDGDGIKDILVGNEAGDDNPVSLSGEAHILFLNADDTLKESQKISNESEFTRDGSTPFAVSDIFGHGMALWKDTGSTAIIAISATQDDTGGGAGNQGAVYLFSITRTAVPSGGGGGSTDEHKTKPTFGIDHKTFVQRVEGGLIINGAIFDVTDNFWTEIPMQNLTVGDVQNFTATVYAPKQLRIMEFLFGIPEVGKWNDAEASVSLIMDYNKNIIEVETYNKKDTIIDFDIMDYSSSEVFCKVGDSTPICDRVSIEIIFNEAPIGKVLALQAIDWKGRNNILYFNDGLNIDGPSLNPPKQKEILSQIKYKGLQTIERIDKINDIWVSTDINEPIALYQKNSLGSFVPYQWREYEKLMDNDGSIMYRDHSYFQMLVELERERAQITYDKLVNKVQ